MACEVAEVSRQAFYGWKAVRLQGRPRDSSLTLSWLSRCGRSTATTMGPMGFRG